MSDDMIESPEIVYKDVVSSERADTDDIKPRIDEDGVPWCDTGCPQYDRALITLVEPDKSLCSNNAGAEWLCPVHARRVVQWAEKVRDLPGSHVAGLSVELAALIRACPGEKGGE